jgi:sec-independent protein translocase protein TatA
MGSGVISPWHIAIFALVVLLVFGPKRLPEMGRSLGKGMREFKDSISHHHDQLDQSEASPALPPATQQEVARAPEHDTL